MHSYTHAHAHLHNIHTYTCALDNHLGQRKVALHGLAWSGMMMSCSGASGRVVCGAEHSADLCRVMPDVLDSHAVKHIKQQHNNIITHSN